MVVGVDVGMVLLFKFYFFFVWYVIRVVVGGMRYGISVVLIFLGVKFVGEEFFI